MAKWNTLAVAMVGASALFWACGSDVVNVESSATGGQAGGAGGATSTATATASTASSTASTASTTASSSTGGPMGPCEQACDKIANECGFGNVCSQIPFLNCADMASDCYGNCILQADCSALPSLLTSNPDPKLAGCISACMGSNGSCQQCVVGQCSSEIQACQNSNGCQGFAACAFNCNNSESCLDDCASKNPSTETTALLACTKSKCASECTGGGSGGSGGGGQGGQGGQGGN